MTEELYALDIGAIVDRQHNGEDEPHHVHVDCLVLTSRDLVLLLDAIDAHREKVPPTDHWSLTRIREALKAAQGVQ